MATVVVVVSVLGLAGCGASRQQLVAERGAEVMPFDLDATTHQFAPTVDGGIETVTSDDPADDHQVELVRSHLREEAAAFAAGDFGDPVDIHGADMPGVAVLAAGVERLDITYDDVTAGARLVFVTDDPALVDALHDWFEAQTSDHGGHATHDD